MAVLSFAGVAMRGRIMRAVMCVSLLALIPAAPAAQSPASAAAFQDLRAELAAKIATAGATTLSIDCEQNLRDRMCVAEIVKGGSHDLVFVSRLHATPAVREPALALDARPLFAQRTPILDVAAAPDGKRIVVLEPAAVSIRQWTLTGGVSEVVESRPVQTARVWPRDL